MDLHWLGFMGLGDVFSATSFYYVLLRGFWCTPSSIPRFSHATIHCILFCSLVGGFSLAVTHHNSHSGLPWYYRVAGGWSDGGSLLLFSNLPYLILAPASPRIRVAQAGFTLVPLPGLMLVSVTGVFR